MSLASGRRPMRAKGKSMMSGSQKRLKRKGWMASSVSGPPSWNRTMPRHLAVRTIPSVFPRTCGCYLVLRCGVKRRIVNFPPFKTVSTPYKRRRCRKAKPTARPQRRVQIASLRSPHRQTATFPPCRPHLASACRACGTPFRLHFALEAPRPARRCVAA